MDWRNKNIQINVMSAVLLNKLILKQIIHRRKLHVHHVMLKYVHFVNKNIMDKIYKYNYLFIYRINNVHQFKMKY